MWKNRKKIIYNWWVNSLRSRLQALFPGRDNGGRRLQQLTQTEVDVDATLEDPWRMGFYDVKMRF